MTEEIAPPPEALYGIWNTETKSWTGEWLYSDNAAQEAAEDCARSGLPLIVVAAHDNVDDEWLNEIEV